jgi:hypothetical protein
MPAFTELVNALSEPRGSWQLETETGSARNGTLMDIKIGKSSEIHFQQHHLDEVKD